MDTISVWFPNSTRCLSENKLSSTAQVKQGMCIACQMQTSTMFNEMKWEKWEFFIMCNIYVSHTIICESWYEATKIFGKTKLRKCEWYETLYLIDENALNNAKTECLLLFCVCVCVYVCVRIENPNFKNMCV